MNNAATIAPFVTPTPVTAVTTGLPLSTPRLYGKDGQHAGLCACVHPALDQADFRRHRALRIRVSARVGCWAWETGTGGDLRTFPTARHF